MKVKKPTFFELSNNSTIVKSSILLVLLLTVSMFLGAQKAGPDVVLGTAQDFSKMIGDHVNKTQSNNKYSNVLSEQSNQITLKTPTGEFTGVVNLAHTLGSSDQIVGAGEKSGSEFELHSEADGTVSGLYTSVSDNVAYEYYTDSTNSTVRVKEVDISSVLCVEYNMVADSSVLNSATDANQRRRLIQPIFESLPNSKFVAYLDFDGEVYQGNWDGGQVINAQPINYSDKDIETIWEYVREDFAPFDINITTSRAVYDATPTSNKMMVIITSTNWRGSGGVAYVNSFGTNTVCWAFNSGISACSITISHELGHTMGLYHKGDPSTAYYAGHSDWGPIMGAPWGPPVVQWSKGEYPNANDTRDELQIIASNNGFGYRSDQVGNNIQSASPLTVQANGAVSTNDNEGLIEKTTDVDVFSFSTNQGGNVALSIMPSAISPNLNIKARLLDANGNQILVSDPSGTLVATLMGTVGQGTFYVEIDGVGDGANPSVGYSDYNSMGPYSIGGSVPPNAVTTDCNNDIGGTASVDNCGVCAGGNTGITPNTTCTVDCNNVVNGTAFIDGCNICVGGNTGKTASVSTIPTGFILLGNEGETKTLPSTSDVIYGIPCKFIYQYGVSGSIAINNGTFSGDPAPGVGKKAYYKPIGTVDCNGVAGGTASVDNCGVCSGGNTGLVANTSCTDCNNVVNGAASIDNCNVCSGGNTGIIANSSCNTDCNGDANGTAFIDGCNICVGGNTGKSKIVNGIPDGYVLLGNEGDTKTLPTKSDVVYGHGCSFTYLYGVSGSVAINNGTFGDPAPGQVKKAYYKTLGVVTSINEQTTVSDLNIYPNPVRDQVTIDGEFNNWTLTDSKGAFIKAGTEEVIDVSALNSGLYYLSVDGGVMKFIKI